MASQLPPGPCTVHEAAFAVGRGCRSQLHISDRTCTTWLTHASLMPDHVGAAAELIRATTATWATPDYLWVQDGRATGNRIERESC
jgi:hypothetical protein